MRYPGQMGQVETINGQVLINYTGIYKKSRRFVPLTDHRELAC